MMHLGWPARFRSLSIAKIMVVAACLLGAGAICFYPLVLHPTDVLVGPQHDGQNDLTSHFLASRGYPALAWRDFGEPPYWNPYVLSGAPYWGNPQSALFYPPNWLFLFADPIYAASWLLVLHHLWGGLGAYLLCRRYRCSQAAATVGAIVMIGAPYLLSHTAEGHYNQICLVTWFPWALLAFERLRAGKRGGVALVSAVMALCFFCGHAQEVFYLGLTLSALVVWDVVQGIRHKNLTAGTRLLRNWLLACGATFGLVAVDLFPIWFYTQQAVRAHGLSVSEAGVGMEAANLWQLLNPWALGGPATYDRPGRFFWEMIAHFGVVPLLLAGLGVALAWRRYPVRRISALFLTAFAFAFGAVGVVFVVFYYCVPAVSWFRMPSRALFLCALAVAVLAAVGVDRIRGFIRTADGSRKSVQRYLGLGLGLATCLLIAAVCLQPSDGFQFKTATVPRPVGEMSAAGLPIFDVGGPASLLGVAMFGRPLSWVWLVGGLGVIWLSLRFRRVRIAYVGLALLCALELGVFAGRVFRTSPAPAIRQGGPIVTLLREHAGNARVLAQQELLSDREAMRNHLQKVQGYDPVPLVAAALAIDAMTPGQDPAHATLGFEHIDLASLDKKIVDLLGVRFAVVGAQQAGDLPGWKLVQEGQLAAEFVLRDAEPRQLPYRIYENETALPRAFVVGQARDLPESGDYAAALASIDARREVLLPRDVLPEGPRAKYQPATVVRYTPRRVIVEVELQQPGYLVLSDLWYPGWQAEDNGQRVGILAANAAFRAVPLLAGKHRVVFNYNVPALGVGGLVTLITIFLIFFGTSPWPASVPRQA